MSARFADGKDDRALRTIGEVSAALGIKTHVLRYWEQQFSSLQPLKRSGRRYYRSEDIALLETIDRLVNREGYTLKGAQQALESGQTSASPPSWNAGDMAGELAHGRSTDGGDALPSSRVSADVLVRLKAIRSRLAQALDA